MEGHILSSVPTESHGPGGIGRRKEPQTRCRAAGWVLGSMIQLYNLLSGLLCLLESPREHVSPSLDLWDLAMLFAIDMVWENGAI